MASIQTNINKIPSLKIYGPSRMLNIVLKAKYSFISAVLFFIIANPELYKMTQYVFGSLFTVAEKGCPTISGLLLHTIVFFAGMFALMTIPSL